VEVVVFQRGVSHFKRKFQVEGNIAINLFLYQNLDWLPFHVVCKFLCMFFRFVTKHACDGRTDRQTDGQNNDFQDRASIAASRGNKTGCIIIIIIIIDTDTLSVLLIPQRKYWISQKARKHEFQNKLQFNYWTHLLLRVAWTCVVSRRLRYFSMTLYTLPAELQLMTDMILSSANWYSNAFDSVARYRSPMY